MLNFKAIKIGFVIIININNEFLLIQLIHTYQDLLYMPHPLFYINYFVNKYH